MNSERRLKLPLAAALALCWVALPSVAAAQGVAVLPALKVLDAGGNPVGPVVGFSSTETPLIRVIDPVNSVPVILEVVGQARLATIHETYFANVDCGGQAYHSNVGFDTGMSSITGFKYSVAQAPSGNQKLYVSEQSDVLAPVTYNSYFWFDVTVIIPALADYECVNSTPLDPVDLREATQVLDLDGLHPPAYSIE